MLFHRRRRAFLLPLAVLAGACSEGGGPSEPAVEEAFATGRVVARVQRDAGGELRLDEPVQALHMASVLDPARAVTWVLGSGRSGGAFDAPMLQLIIPGALSPRAYPAGFFDLVNGDGVDDPSALPQTLGLVQAGGAGGGAAGFFTTAGGTVQVVGADGTPGAPGRLRARLDLRVREVRPDRSGYGGQGTARGTLDGPLVFALASDARLSLAGAVSGSTRGEFPLDALDGVTAHGRTWTFWVGDQGWVELHLGRIPAAGETLPLQLLRRQQVRFDPDDASGAVLIIPDPAAPADQGFRAFQYVSTAGELRVESADAWAVRGTLTATLQEYDPSTGRLGARTVTATGPVGLVLQEPVFPAGG
jgi:hypothetical protein